MENLPLDKIRYQIEIEKKTKKWVANEFGVSYSLIQKYCKKYNIKFRWPIEKIREMIEVDGLKHWEVGRHLGINEKYVSDLCKKNHIKSQRRGPRNGPGHPDWKGGKTINQGYCYVYSPGHPYARKGVPYVLEHRLVMEKHIGRYLLPCEVVHHINKNTLDNRLENLELFENNACHLKAELMGHVPNWSEDGKQKILQGARKARKNQKASKPCDS